MPISANTLRLLIDAGLEGERLIAVVESIEADSAPSAADEARLAGARARAKRYRERGGGKIPDELRQAVLERDSFQCVYCGSSDHLQMDHVTPVSKGGETSFENLATACRECNARKRDQTRKQIGRNSDITRTDASPDKERFQTSKEINPIPPSPPSGAQTPTAKTRGSRLPDDFVPDLEVAISLGLDRERARLEADKFADHWRSAPGQRGVKLDWPATWRNWCRRALESRSGPGPPNGRGKQQTYFDLVREIDRNIQDADENGQTHVYPAIPAKAH